MKKVLCYILGMLFAMSAGMAYIEAWISASSKYPLAENKLLTGTVFYIILPIVFVLFLTRYNFAAANSFGKMRYAPLFLTLGLISAAFGGFIVIKGMLPEAPETILYIILFITTFATYKAGRLIAKNYKKQG